jgi:hypothetical protein
MRTAFVGQQTHTGSAILPSVAFHHRTADRDILKNDGSNRLTGLAGSGWHGFPPTSRRRFKFWQFIWSL